MSTTTRKVFTMRRRVELADTDMAGIVHFTTFFRYLETAEHELWRSLGLVIFAPGDKEHMGWPRVACSFEFKSPLRFGDDVEIRIGVESISRRAVTYLGEVVCGGKVVASGKSTSVHCRVNAVSEQVESVDIPDDVRDKLATYMETDKRAEG